MEPQAHYIPTNPLRLKSELMAEKSRGRSKNANMQGRSNYQQKYANGAGAHRNMDHIPDPQIIFNTTSSKSVDQAMDKLQMEHNNHEMDLSTQSMASPLQLLSTAASCTPKLKITPQIHQHQQPPSPQQQPLSQPPSIPSQNAVKTVQNRAIKIIPANTKPVIIKTSEAVKTNRPIITTAQSSNFKIQKIQLLMNKTPDGTSATASLSPSATIVSGKAGQLVLSGKGITNSYHVSGKQPYTIVTGSKSAPKVIVQTIDKTFTMKDSQESSSIPENQRITENTPIDFLPSNLGMTSYPKVIIQKSPSTVTKQIKLKLGTSLVNPKIIKGPIPANLKIQRNISSKGFTVLNSSQIVQLQAQTQAAVQIAQTPTTPTQTPPTEGTKVDWEQELDDANRTKGGKSVSKSNGSSSAAKKMRLDEDGVAVVESVQEVPDTENVIETVDVIDPSNFVVFGKV